MDTKLVIVESPAKAKTISKFLGRGYKVEASSGHVRDLPKSQLGVDVEHEFEPKYITIRGRGDIIDRIRKEAKNASKIYLATDPDREGEAISWHLAQLLKLSGKDVHRVEFHEITNQTVKNAIKHPRPIKQDLVDAQQARRILDRLVGYQISPLLWDKVQKGLSAGRVQSVAARIICDREAEIEAFVPREYWTLKALLSRKSDAKTVLEARYHHSGDKKSVELNTKEDVDAVVESAKDKPFIVDSVKQGEKRKQAPAPFTTSSLQQEAARKLGFTTRRTMALAQQLYEGVDVQGVGLVGLVTYIRTDSTRIAQEAQQSAMGHIQGRYGKDYVPEKPNQFRGRRGAQDAHEAIRPSSLELTPESVKGSLNNDQLKLYRLIYNRFLASQMTPALYETMTVTILAGEHEFRLTGSRCIFQGYQIVYSGVDGESEEEEQNLPEFTVGERLDLEDLIGDQHFTEPPPRYTEASLVRALEEQGIGRPSTYAPIISTLLDRGYIRREQKTLAPTELGQIVTNLMKEHFQRIVDVEFTADMESQLDSVEEGDVGWRQIVSQFYGPFEEALKKAEATIEKVEVQPEVTDVICELCGANMIVRSGRFGKFLACPNYPECRNTKPIVQQLDVPCPKCGAKVVIRRSRKGRAFYGCERYPNCDFISWDMPVKERCPQCGAYMVRKQNRKGDASNHCTNENCKHSYPVQTDNAEA